MKTYSIWMSEDKTSFTLCKGIFPNRLGNGTLDPDCQERILVFTETCWCKANKVYDLVLNTIAKFMETQKTSL